MCIEGLYFVFYSSLVVFLLLLPHDHHFWLPAEVVGLSDDAKPQAAARIAPVCSLDPTYYQIFSVHIAGSLWEIPQDLHGDTWEMGILSISSPLLVMLLFLSAWCAVNTLILVVRLSMFIAQLQVA